MPNFQYTTETTYAKDPSVDAEKLKGQLDALKKQKLDLYREINDMFRNKYRAILEAKERDDTITLYEEVWSQVLDEIWINS